MTEGPHHGEPYFRHAPRAPGDRPLQHATRYLSAGAYLRVRFERRVISELLYEPNRAVVPSFGFDLEVVLRHALRARRLRLARDMTLIVLWTLAYLPAPRQTVGVGMTLFGVAVVIAGARWLGRAGARARRNALGALLLLAAGYGGLVWFGGRLDGGSGYDSSPPSVPIEDVGAENGLLTPVTLLALAVVVLGHRALVLRSLSRALAPGAMGPGPAVRGDRAEQALARIGSAQNGNITLYGGENPFLGAGRFDARRTVAWSIVLELDRPSGKGSPDLRKERARPDPVAMYARVREEMQAMRDEWPPHRPGAPEPRRDQWLPPNERVVSMVITDHVVGHGEVDHRRSPASPDGGHPLVDPRGGGVPYSVATPPAIEAIMRHPQAGARYYQRITVGAQSQQVVGRAGDPVLDAEEQDYAVSTFLHLAIEGRMLYAQFAAVPLPPVRDEFRVVDVASSWTPAHLVGHTLLAGWRDAAATALLAVPRTARTLAEMASGALAARYGRPPITRVIHDYGARLSVRELGAARGFGTYMQELDVVKYTRLVQQRVNDAVLDYLEGECGVDVSAYRAQAAQITNNSVTITGDVSGQVAVGGQVQQKQGDD
ncbi:hypothetical protein GCM10009678_71420 [Actinomadura kijaniata]|uniref:Uncharacterized protein n=1 Tax=Actinomadura namibiensis TaxID=182080 RepID=A0A7W3QQC6_ACTNM|nr:hypothetical protein [Actinomadura namibiensis]MBA8955574.1 hypothetical protein [Actinomadura namibiensis]